MDLKNNTQQDNGPKTSPRPNDTPTPSTDQKPITVK